MPRAIYPLLVRPMSVAGRVAIAVLITFTAALPGMLFPPARDGWFGSLAEPFFAPPPGVFAPVWTVLYTMMGIAAGLVWAQHKLVAVKPALSLYAAQLLLNALWTVVFFGMHAPDAALVVILCLLVFIALTIRAFLAVDRTSARLLFPYLIWVAFATVLNAGYVYLN
jgi:translocator protein